MDFISAVVWIAGIIPVGSKSASIFSYVLGDHDMYFNNN